MSPSDTSDIISYPLFITTVSVSWPFPSDDDLACPSSIVIFSYRTS